MYVETLSTKSCSQAALTNDLDLGAFNLVITVE